MIAVKGQLFMILLKVEKNVIYMRRQDESFQNPLDSNALNDRTIEDRWVFSNARRLVRYIGKIVTLIHTRTNFPTLAYRWDVNPLCARADIQIYSTRLHLLNRRINFI